MMYYPKQIPYILDKEFNENVEYTEYNLKELEKYSIFRDLATMALTVIAVLK